MKLAFLGLGRMGGGMAANLVGKGHTLVVWNRTRNKADALTAKGARVADTPADAVREAEVAVTMVSDDRALEEIVFGEHGLLEALPRGAIHLGASTVSPSMSRRIAEAQAERGQEYVAAPVLGRPDVAEAGKLTFVAAGARDAVDACWPLFEAMGAKVHVLGEDPQQANAAKLGVNFTLATMIEALGEAYALAEAYDVDAKAFLEIVNGSLFKSPVVEAYGERIAEREFEPAGFRLALGAKDVRLATEASESKTVAMPLASMLRYRFVAAMEGGLADADWSAVGRH